MAGSSRDWRGRAGRTWPAARASQSRRRARPALERLEDRLSPAADLSLVAGGLSASLFSGLQDRLNSDAFARPVPVVGDQLATLAAGQFLAQIGTDLADFAPAQATVTGILAELDGQLRDWLRPSVGGVPSIRSVGIDGQDLILFQVDLRGSLTVMANMELDLGDEGTFAFYDYVADSKTGIADTEGKVRLQVDWSLDLEFGVENSTFFASTVDANELNVDVTAQLGPDFLAQGKMGIVPASFASIDGKPTFFRGAYRTDLRDPGNDGRLTPDEYATSAVVATLGGQDLNADGLADGPAIADINLKVQGSFLPKAIDPAQYSVLGLSLGKFFNLNYETDLHYGVSYANIPTTSEVYGTETAVTFTDVQMDIFPLFTQYIKPIIKRVQDTFKPVKPIIDALTSPIPVLGEFLASLEGASGSFTLLDLVRIYYTQTRNDPQGYSRIGAGVQLIKDVLNFKLSTLDDVGENAKASLGTFAANSKKSILSSNLDGNLRENLKNQSAVGQGAKKVLTDFQSDFQFPFLDDPALLFRMILGDDTVDLFKFNLEFELGLEYTQFFPLFYGIGISVYGSAGAKFNIGVGYDSKGLVDFLKIVDNLEVKSFDTIKDAVKDNVKLLSKGLYFDDHNARPDLGDNNDYDDPEATLYVNFGIGPGFGIDLKIIKAFLTVQGTVGADFFFDLNDLPTDADADTDPGTYTYDGKIRLDEFRTIVDASPKNLFNISGDLRAGLRLQITIEAGIPPTLFKIFDYSKQFLDEVVYNFNIYQPNDQEILAGIVPDAVPQLGTLNAATGVLTLNVGDRAFFRGAELLTTDEDYEIVGLGPDAAHPGRYRVLVLAFNGSYEQEFDNVAAVYGDFKGGDDRATISGDFGGDVSVFGGSGSDRLIQRSTGRAYFYGEDDSDVLRGGGSNDNLDGGGSNDQIDGGAGNDAIFGTGGGDILIGGLGNDTIEGGTGNDFLDGGEGDDSLYGGDNEDYLDGGPGNDRIFGEQGGDLAVWQVGGGDDTIDGGGGGLDYLTVLGGQTPTVTPRPDGFNETVVVPDNDEFNLSQVGNQLRLATQNGTIIVSGLNTFSLSTGAGSDRVTLNNMKGFPLENLTLDLKSPESSANEADELILNLGNDDDFLDLFAQDSSIATSELTTDANGRPAIKPGVAQQTVLRGEANTLQFLLRNSLRATDTVRVQGNDGNDTIRILNGTASLQATDLARFLIDGGIGGDRLVNGASGGVTLLGGPGKDSLVGGAGPDWLEGNENDDDITAGAGDVLVSGGSGTDIIRFDDTGRAETDGRVEVAIYPSAIALRRPFQPLSVLNLDGFESMEVKLGPGLGSTGAGNLVRVVDTMPGAVNIFGGELADEFLVVANSGPLGLYGEGGDDLFRLGAGTGAVPALAFTTQIQGQMGSDTIELDNSARFTPLAARVTANGLQNFGTGGLLAYGGVETLSLKLGGGNDVITFEPSALQTTRIVDAGGDDRVQLEIPSALTSTPFGGFDPIDVETLVLNDAGRTAAVAWRAVDGLVSAGSTPIVQTEGFGRTILNAGTATTDSLLVSNTTDTSLLVTVNGPDVRIDSGREVLDRATFQGTSNLPYTRDLTAKVRSGPLVASPDGRFIYGLAYQSLRIWRREDSGRISLVDVIVRGEPRSGGLFVEAMTDPNDLVLSPDGLYLYVLDYNGGLAAFQRDPSSGAVRYLGAASDSLLATASSLIISPDGRDLYATTESAVVRIDVVKPSVPLVSQAYSVPGGIKRNAESNTLVMNAAGTRLYVLAEPAVNNLEGIRTFERNPSTGALTSRGDTFQEAVSSPSAIALSRDGRSLYVLYGAPDAGAISAGLIVYSLNSQGLPVQQQLIREGSPVTGGGVVQGLSGAYELAVSPDGRFVYVSASPYVIPSDATDGIAIFSRNTSTGALTFLQRFTPENVVDVSSLLFVGDDSDTLYAAVTDNHNRTDDPTAGRFTRRITVFKRSDPATGALQTFQTINQESENAILGFTQVLFNGNTIGYGLSPDNGALAILIRNTTTGAVTMTDVASESGSVDGLRGARRMALSPNGASLYVVSPEEDSVAVFAVQGSGLAFLAAYKQGHSSGSQFIDGLAGAADVAVSADGKFVYVLGGRRDSSGELQRNRIAVFSRKADGTLQFVQYESSSNFEAASKLAVGPDGRLYVVSPSRDSVAIYNVNSANGNLTLFQLLRTGLSGLDGAVSLAFSPDGSHLYVSGRDADAITVFGRNAAGQWASLQLVREGFAGVRGLDAVGDLAVSPDGLTLLAINGLDNSVTAFDRDPITGLLTFAQRRRNSYGGAPGQNVSQAIAVVGNSLYVSSSGRNGGEGGLATMTVGGLSAPPFTSRISFTGIEVLTVTTAGGDDVVNVITTSVPTDLNTGAGADDLTVQTTGAGLLFRASLGEDNDSAVVRAAGGRVEIGGEAGDDFLRLITLPANVTANLDGGDGLDEFRVNGSTSLGSIEVTGGGQPAGSLGDALFFDTQGRLLRSNSDVTPPDGKLRLVDADNTTNFFDVERVNILNLPLIARLDGPRFLFEGATIGAGLISAARSTLPTDRVVTADWDLNGDGQFGDARGLEPGLSWDDLVALGLDDDGSYPIAVRLTTDRGETDFASSTLTIANVAPRNLTVGGQDGVVGSPVTFFVSATDPADALTYEFDFDANGSYEASTTSETIQHIFTAPGRYTVRVRANDGDGGTVLSATVVNIVAAVPTVATISTAGPRDEGSLATINLGATGPGAGAITSWFLDWGDGSRSEVAAGATSTATHRYADNGTFTVTARAISPTALYDASPISQVVRNVIPEVRIAASDPSGVPKAGVPFSMNLFVGTDPGDDVATNWLINWGDGTFEWLTLPRAGASHVYAAGGSYTILSAVRDDDGLFLTNALTVDVAVDPPVIPLEGADTVAEGGTYALTLRPAIDPAGRTFVAYTIDWGDGQTTEVAAPGLVTHVYRDGGVAGTRYPVRVDVRDETGAIVTDVGRLVVDGSTAPFSVLVGNVAPILPISGPGSVEEGSPYVLTHGLVADPGDDLVTEIEIDWGDGTTTRFPYANAAGTVAHTYRNAAGLRSIRASLVDEDGTYLSPVTVPVNVLATPPRVELSGADSVDEGSTYHLRVAELFDPSGVIRNPRFYRIRWGDGDFLTGDQTDMDAVPHVYADGPYTFTISVDVEDGPGQWKLDLGRRTVRVRNVGPVLTSFRFPSVVQAGSPASFGADAFDPAGSADPLTFLFGVDASLPPIASASSTFQHTYTTSGPRRVSVIAFDDNGAASGLLQGELWVDSTITLGTVSTSKPVVRPGEMFSLTGSFSATATGDAHEVEVRWGDGQTSTVSLPAGVTVFELGHSYADANGPDDTRGIAYPISVIVKNAYKQAETTVEVRVDDPPRIRQTLALYGNNRIGGPIDARAILPWSIRGVRVEFTEDVLLDGDVLRLLATSGRFLPTGTFSYDTSTHTAQWTFPGPLNDGRYRLQLDGDDATTDGRAGIRDQGGTSLGSGDRTYNFGVLLGDTNGDGIVNSSDIAYVRSRAGQIPDVWDVALADLDGDGDVDQDDLLIVRQRSGRRL